MPEDWRSYDALYIKALDPYQKEIFTWSFPLKDPDGYQYEIPATGNSEGAVSAYETGTSFVVQTQNITFEFDKKTGTLVRAFMDKYDIPLNNGPRFITNQEVELSDVHHRIEENGEFTLEFLFQGDISKFRNIQYLIKWTARTNGLLDLDVSGHYMQGISFDYPEEKIQSIKRLSDGPFRVWRNRIKGTKLGVWENDYNNTITGDPASNYDYPEGDISFLNAIPPIGTMFRKTEVMGPQSQRETDYGWDAEPVTMKLTFDFLTR